MSADHAFEPATYTPTVCCFRLMAAGVNGSMLCGQPKSAHPQNPTPAYVPQDGHRVRFTADGVITGSGKYGSAHVMFDGSSTLNGIQVGVGTWDRLPDPLPTTPGSVIRADGCLMHLTEADRWWVNDHGDGFPKRHVITLADVTVLFDAGATP